MSSTPTGRHVAALAASAMVVAAMWGCVRWEPMRLPGFGGVPQQFFLLYDSRAVDILFVIDNSPSMLNEQENLRSRFVVLMEALRNTTGGLPNLHIGVVSADLGTGSHDSIQYCERVGGDRGILGRVKGIDLADTCIGPGQRYIADVEPAECQINKDLAGTCTGHTCTPQHCVLVTRGAEVLMLVTDDNGCPRCRNYRGSLEETFSCLAGLGADGCGFQQQLEAMYKALDETSTPENWGFLTEEAFLAVITVTDEDDCSASMPDVIFDPDPALDTIDSTLGYLQPFRCFEFGVTCDANGRQEGVRSECVSREDSEALLHPVTRYTAFLEAMKDPLMLFVAAIAGPYEGSVEVGSDDQGRPEVKPTCTESTGHGASPAIRLKGFAEHFNYPDEMAMWAFTSVCSTDFAPALQSIGDRISGWISEPCLVQPYAGCPRGPGGTPCSPCLPSCNVSLVERRGLPDQARLRVPWCGEICATGLCTEDQLQDCELDENGRCTCPPPFCPTRLFDRVGCAPLHYDDAMPDLERDRALADLVPRKEPSCFGTRCADGTEGLASACWYLTARTLCGYGASFRVVLAGDPPPRTFVDGRCELTYDSEMLCNNGDDDDEDCLIDDEDPDCGSR